MPTFTIGDKVRVLRNIVQAYGEDGKLLVAGDVVTITNFREGNIVYLVKTTPYYLPIEAVEMFNETSSEPHKCTCSRSILWEKGCQCGGT